MIALLRGKVAVLEDDHVILDVQGVGYLVHAPARTLQRLPGPGEAAQLHIETQMREDAITLFGFLEPGERQWFRILQTVQGVGSRVALAILGVLGPAELVAAVAAQDKAAFSRASGVGARLATRLVTELKDRVGELPHGAAAAAPAAGAAGGGGGAIEDALEALVRLGFARTDAYAAVTRVRAAAGGEPGVDVLIRESLKELAR
ncbi:Holliday junction branch migration protein RuvA [Geminicoccaceae bacterium 1502E]|nr:Holliday junction branch migration protein RuvA [Geminicoccaceae bacterium 1502E]